MRKFVFALFIAFFALPAYAQPSVDYQLRPLMHWQAGHFAGWSILPDVTQTQPFRGLAVAGWLIKNGGKNWVEVMAGGVFGSDGSKAPAVNIRTFQRTDRMDLYSELQIRPDRALASLFLVAPLKFKGFEFRSGLEFETVTALDNGVKNQVLLGPRISFAVPHVPWLSVATVAYTNLKGQVIVRHYVLATLKH